MVEATGIEPAISACKADVFPLALRPRATVVTMEPTDNQHIWWGQPDSNRHVHNDHCFTDSYLFQSGVGPIVADYEVPQDYPFGCLRQPALGSVVPPPCREKVALGTIHGLGLSGGFVLLHFDSSRLPTRPMAGDDGVDRKSDD
jgi:hypothetical protein